ncbi:MAG: hypothetical protein ACRDPX_08625 [Gaiellaceae bacterium]
MAVALWAKYAGALIAILLLGALGIIIFDRIWYQVGLGAAIVVVCGGLLFFAWWTDRKDKAARAGLEDI